MKRQDTSVIFINQFIVVLKALKMHKKTSRSMLGSQKQPQYMTR